MWAGGCHGPTQLGAKLLRDALRYAHAIPLPDTLEKQKVGIGDSAETWIGGGRPNVARLCVLETVTDIRRSVGERAGNLSLATRGGRNRLLF